MLLRERAFFCAVTAVLLLATVQPVLADGERIVINADYSAAVPLGATRDLTSDASFQGIGVEARFYTKYFLSGVAASWQVFRDERQEPSTITGSRFEARTSSLIPILATGHKVWHKGRFQPMIGVGLGAMAWRQTIEAQGEEETNTEWYAAVSADGGGYYVVADGVGIIGHARYVAGFKSGESPQMLQFCIGITFIY